MSDESASGTERETVYVDEPPRRIFGNLLIDGCDGQCAYIYAGIGERCPNDAVAHTFLSSGKRVEMCAEHARENVPEPPQTKQSDLVTDGGQASNGMEHCRECGNPTVFLTYESQEDGRCAHCRLGIPWHNRSIDPATDCQEDQDA